MLINKLYYQKQNPFTIFLNSFNYKQTKMGLRLLKSVFQFPKRNVFECLLPFMYLTRLFAYFNFTIEGNLTNAVIKIKPFNIMVFVLYSAIYIPIIVFSIMRGPETYNSFFMDTGNYVFLVICHTNTVISSTILFVSNYYYWDILKSCYEVDQILEQFGVYINHQQHFRSYLKYISLEVVFFIAINAASVLIYNSSLHQNVFPFGYLSMTSSIYITLLSVIIVRFESINIFLM